MQDHDLGIVLRRMSAHVAMLAELVHQAENAIGDCYDLPRGDARAIAQLQSLDYLRQSLEDLTILTKALGSLPGGGRASAAALKEACGALRLADTRAIVLAPTHRKAGPVPTPQSGELDLF